MISTKYDLNQPVYQAFAPQIYISQTYKYQTQDYNYKNDSYQVQFPTQEELEKAKKYQSKIPNYGVSNDDKNIDNVVVGYTELEEVKSSIPEAFNTFPGDVPLDPKYINANGKLPAGFEDFHPKIKTQEYGNAHQPLLYPQQSYTLEPVYTVQQDQQGFGNILNYQQGYQPPNA